MASNIPTNSSEAPTMKATVSEIKLCEVSQVNPPKLEQVSQSNTPRPRTASYSVQAAERDPKSMSSAELKTLAERNKAQKACEQRCPTKRSPRDVNPPPTDEELGKLISDRSCDFAQKKLWYSAPGFLAVAHGGKKVYKNWASKLPLWSGFARYELAAIAVAIALPSVWKHMRTDQVYHNEETKRFHFRTTPVMQDPQWTQLEDGTRRKYFMGPIRSLKRAVNKLPDGFMAPLMKSGRITPVITTGHAKDREAIKDMFPYIPEESEV